MQDLPDVTHARTMCTESITKQIRWRCTDVNARKNRGGMNHRIPKAFRHRVTDIRLWARKNLGFAPSLGFVACKSWGCWAQFLCSRGDGVLRCYPAALRRDTCHRGRDHSQGQRRLLAQTLLRIIPGQHSHAAPAPAALVGGSFAISQYPTVGNTYSLVIDLVHSPRGTFNTQK